MALIKCPGCGTSEKVDLQGRYLVKCTECGQEFTAIIISQRKRYDIRIVCPKCGYSEQISGSNNVLEVACRRCGYSFVVPGNL